MGVWEEAWGECKIGSGNREKGNVLQGEEALDMEGMEMGAVVEVGTEKEGETSAPQKHMRPQRQREDPDSKGLKGSAAESTMTNRGRASRKRKRQLQMFQR